MEVYIFRRISFPAPSWKQVWAEPGRITYKAAQDRAMIEVIDDQGEKLRFKADKGAKVAVAGNGLHVPENVPRW
jgi:hypothetical protein